MTPGSSVNKLSDRKKPSPGQSGAAQFFRPLSPFAPAERGEDEQLPDWVRTPGVQRRPVDNPTYNFDWLSNPDTERTTSSATRTNRHPQYSPSPHPPAAERPSASREPTHSDSFGKVDSNTGIIAETVSKSGSINAMQKDNLLPPTIEQITESTPEKTLKIARSLSQEGNLQAALGHYLYLVKSDQKLEEVVADLESQRANPHTKQTPLMLQTLADAYTKTGELEKALPLYRQALGR